MTSLPVTLFGSPPPPPTQGDKALEAATEGFGYLSTLAVALYQIDRKKRREMALSLIKEIARVLDETKQHLLMAAPPSTPARPPALAGKEGERNVS